MFSMAHVPDLGTWALARHGVSDTSALIVRMFDCDQISQEDS